MLHHTSPDIVKDHQRCCTVMVQGFDPSKLELCQLYFENPRKTGGTSTDFRINENENIIYVTFQTPEEAEKVTKLTHIVGGKQLQVTLAPIDDPVTSPPCTIKITGCDPEKEELYRLYFENPRRGGGTIEDLVVDKEKQVIYITFEEPETAINVCNKTHKVGGCDLEVSLHVPTKDEKSMNQTQEANNQEPLKTVQLQVGKKIQSEDNYLYYFESKRSGGGEVERISIDQEKGIVYVTFVQPEAAARVTDRQHVIGGEPIKVSLFVPPAPKPTYPNKLLFSNVSKSTTHDCLSLFLEFLTGLEPTELIYADSLEDILAVFNEEPDFEKVQESCKKKCLEGRQISVSRVPISNCILVQNLNKNTTEDTIMYYFESKRRSLGGPVEKVNFDSGNNRCLVFFEDHEVVDAVLTKNHVLDGQELRVKQYLECLGPSGGSKDFK